ncbi:MAG: hypothetical protein K0R08_2058 [Solimicrobium sp.]|nr:hypothetical protein [Solimicrobium sp.]
MALIVNPSPNHNSQPTDNKSGLELSAAFAKAAKQLPKKKGYTEDPVASLALPISQMVPLQDRSVQSGESVLNVKQTPSGNTSDTVKQIFTGNSTDTVKQTVGGNSTNTVKQAFAANTAPTEKGKNAHNMAPLEFTPLDQMARPTTVQETEPKLALDGAKSSIATRITEVRSSTPVMPQLMPAPEAAPRVAGELAGKKKTAELKSKNRKISELTSALPTIAAFEQSARNVASGTLKEPLPPTSQGVARQAEVLASRDKSSPPETKFNFAWGGGQSVYISGTLAAGYKLRASDSEVKRILDRHLPNQEVALSLGVTSVESATDKEPKQGQSTSHHADDADE